MLVDIAGNIDTKNDGYYLCSGCAKIVKGKKMVSFRAFGMPMRVCTKCSKEALKNITEALERIKE